MKNINKIILTLITLSLISFSLAQTTVKVGLGYLPDVQFAPFYLAEVEGLYAEQGLEVEFQHGFASELYPLLSQGKLDFVVADAEDVISLRSQDEEGAAFKYILALYQTVPNALFSLEDAGISSLADLKGKTLGMPGMFGTSLTSLQAMMQAEGLSEDDFTIEQIGFTQLEAVLSKRVDVAMGFINNEPVVLTEQGVAINVIPAGETNPSPGNGVITSDAVLENNILVQSFLNATQNAMRMTIDQPELAFESAKTYVENLTEDRMQVLKSSIALYESETTSTMGLGVTPISAWEETLELMKSTGRVETELSADAFFDYSFLVSPAPPTE